MSDVILLNYYSDEIACIELHDEASHNTFSDAFIEGIYEVFTEINANDAVKVVVVHGYDNYFCCGGTKDGLLRIARSEIHFNDLDFFRQMLDCPIPCIAAMQGHAMGGGLAFSCYADIMILSEESFYTSNFMNYGFTPGMGATYVGQEKFGKMLANEMFYTGHRYKGIELKERGVPLLVLPQSEVISAALEMAEEIADKPRLSLVTLKKHLIQPIIERLPQVIKQELEMHNITFQNPEVIARIEKLF